MFNISKISPAVNTDTKSESCVIADSVGVVDSVGDALFIDDDIPPIFAESGIFDKAE